MSARNKDEGGNGSVAWLDVCGTNSATRPVFAPHVQHSVKNIQKWWLFKDVTRIYDLTLFVTSDFWFPPVCDKLLEKELILKILAETAMADEKEPIQSVQTFGRKKTATAVAYAKRGKGLIKVNGRPLEQVEPKSLQFKLMEPVLLLGQDR